MSDQIPFHIQEEIMKRLPVKSLVRFRCVSKPWKSLIDSSKFITIHSLRRHTQPHHLLVSYGHLEDYVLFSRSYIDDETFPKQRSVSTLPHSVKQLVNPRVPGVVSSSQGLLCLIGSHPNFSSTRMAVVWNPSIRKSISVLMPEEPSVENHFIGRNRSPCVGFGVCPVTSDPKIVTITRSYESMVYTLRSGKWTTLSSYPPLKKGAQRLFCTVVTDSGFIYWDVRFGNVNKILSFNLTSEAFDMIHLPDSLARLDAWDVQMSKLRESLALFQLDDDDDSSTVWVMEHDGARISFTKLYTLTTPHCRMVGFRKNGIPIVQYDDGDDHDGREKAHLVVYEPNSEEHNNALEICNYPYNFDVHSYMETLLLLGRSDCISD